MKNFKIPKRVLTLCLALAMVISSMAVPALSFADTDTPAVAHNLVLTANDKQNQPAFRMIADVKADEAEKAGYDKPDAYENQVTAIDAMVVLHRALYGEKFDAAPQDYLVMSSSGWLSKVFGVETYNASYLVNHKMPEYPDKPGTGSVAYDTVLKDNDRFALFMWFSEYYDDTYLYFDKDDINVFTGEEFALNLKGYMPMGEDPANFDQPQQGYRIRVTKADDIDVSYEAVTDEDGNAVFTVEEAGDYSAAVVAAPEAGEDEMGVTSFIAGPAFINVAALPADYSEVDAALDAVPEDLSVYTEESVKALNEAIDAVDRTLTAEDQDKVDAMAEAIFTAIDGLELKEAAVQEEDNDKDMPDADKTDNADKADKADKAEDAPSTGDASKIPLYLLLLTFAGAATVFAAKVKTPEK